MSEEIDDVKLENWEFVDPIYLIQAIDDTMKRMDKKVKSIELDELGEIYKENTGKRPLYKGKPTKGFKEWCEEYNPSTDDIDDEDVPEEASIVDIYHLLYLIRSNLIMTKALIEIVGKGNIEKKIKKNSNYSSLYC